MPAASGFTAIEQRHQEQHHRPLRQEPHRRQQRLADHLVDVGQDVGAEVGAVPVQEPGVGPGEVAGEQPAAHAVAAHGGEAEDRVLGDRLEHRGRHQDHEDGAAEEHQERAGLGEAERLVEPGEVGVGHDRLRPGEHGEERQDRGDADHLRHAHQHDQPEQQVEAAALRRCQQVEDLAVGLEHPFLQQPRRSRAAPAEPGRPPPPAGGVIGRVVAAHNSFGARFINRPGPARPGAAPGCRAAAGRVPGRAGRRAGNLGAAGRPPPRRCAAGGPG